MKEMQLKENEIRACRIYQNAASELILIDPETDEIFITSSRDLEWNEGRLDKIDKITNGNPKALFLVKFTYYYRTSSRLDANLFGPFDGIEKFSKKAKCDAA